MTTYIIDSFYVLLPHSLRVDGPQHDVCSEPLECSSRPAKLRSINELGYSAEISIRAYRIKHIHIPVEHPHALAELQICVWLGRVHVKNVVKSVIVELAEHGICARVGSMFALYTRELLAMVYHSEKRPGRILPCACA